MSAVRLLAAAAAWLLAVSPHAGALQRDQRHSIGRAEETSQLREIAPPTWPDRFHATLFQNRSHSLALTQLYYDWPKQRNLNIITSQLGVRGTVWDLEFGNGTSFIFSREEPLCKTLHFDVGILRKDWLANATLLGEDTTDSFEVNVWTKADFITYYAEVDTQQPVRWTFLASDAQFHVLSFEPGGTLPEKQWQAPAYCFTGNTSADDFEFLETLATGRAYRMPAQPVPRRASDLLAQQ